MRGRGHDACASLYGTWVDGLKGAPKRGTAWTNVRSLIGRLCLDLTVIAGIAIGGSLSTARAVETAQRLTRFEPAVTRLLLVVATLALLAPFVLGAVRLARALGLALAAEALPSSSGGLDLAAAPRRALLVTLQIAILLVVGGPMLVIVQPFYPAIPGPAVLLAFALVLAYPLWRSADNLQGHARAGAQVILEALVSQNQESTVSTEKQARALVPGLGNACLANVESGWPAVGRSLKQIGLRGRSGATVIAIQRGPDKIIYPSADEVFRVGDTLVLAGSADSVQAAMRLLGEK